MKIFVWLLPHYKMTRLPGLDKIEAKMLKDSVLYLLQPLKHVFNLSIPQNVVLDIFKVAIIFACDK